jgi:Fungal chitosanase of glycosyl hydrolase group 75
MSKSAVVHFGDNYIMQLDDKPGILGWTCPLAVDADGHPKAYHPDGSPPGLDYLANAGSPGNWWGIACDSKGNPYVQSQENVAPGFYVSTTALVAPGFHESHPAKYVDSGLIPFIVLPSKPTFSPKQTLGDLAMVFNNKTGKYSWALYADIGPENQLGEGSMALCDALGINSDPKKGGEPSEAIAMIYFPGSYVKWPAQLDHLANAAYQLFIDWGGYDSAKALLPQINWDQFPEIGPQPEPTPIPPPGQQVVNITIDAPPEVTVNVVQNLPNG